MRQSSHIDEPSVVPQTVKQGGGLARYLQEQFLARCPAGWRCTAERPLLDGRDRTLLGYDPRADVMLERTDGTRRLWIEFEVSRADPAANHAKFATAHVLRPWGEADAFVSMISAHVVRGRRNLGAGMIHVMRQVGIDAFQTLLLPDLDRERIKALNHDAQSLRAVRLDVRPEIERVLAVADPVAVRNEGRLHFAADVFDVLLNLRRWNEEAGDPRQADKWRRRSVRYVVVDSATGWCAPAKFAAYVLLPSRHTDSPAPIGIDSRLTFDRYLMLDQAEPLLDGHRAWTYLTRRLGLMVRYQVADEGVAYVVGAIEAAFAAVEAQQPAGVRWAYYRRAGGTEFVALLELDDGVENPLLGIGPARELQSAVARWVAGDAPTPLPLDLLGSYGFVR